MYASIRDQLATEITSGVYPAGALLPSIREIMQRWDVSTTTARKVLDELVAAGFARKESTRGHISTGGPQESPSAPPAGEHARHGPAPVTVAGRLAVRPAQTIPADKSVDTDGGNVIAALDVRAEPPPADAALALRVADPSRPVIARRCLHAAPDNAPVQFRVSYLPTELAEPTPIGRAEPLPEAWPAALATHLGIRVRLARSHITARHPHTEEAAALALASDAALLVREDVYADQHGTPVAYTRTVWPADTTRLVLSD
jgi:DNA-binding GntR family transcriptional regulator